MEQVPGGEWVEKFSRDLAELALRDRLAFEEACLALRHALEALDVLRDRDKASRN